jgi:hypothetical protein
MFSCFTQITLSLSLSFLLFFFYSSRRVWSGYLKAADKSEIHNHLFNKFFFFFFFLSILVLTTYFLHNIV